MPRRSFLLATRSSLWLFLAGLAACQPSSVPPAGQGAAPVVFVGLDGADWQLLDRYAAAGAMPELARLAREGATGTLETLEPPLSPLVWTTMMTGVSPLVHGVLDFTRRNPQSGALEPITRFERRVPAVWNLAGARGRTVAVFGLWATWPAEPVSGLLVSDRFFSFTSPRPAPPESADGIVHPPAEEAWARGILAGVEGRIGPRELAAYLPGLSAADAASAAAAPDPYAHPASALSRILVETAVYHEFSAAWIARHRPDLAIVYFQGTDTLGHVFAPFAPPRQAGISAEDYERYSAVPERYFREIDRLLGDYRRLAEKSGATLMLASDHGFRWGEGRPREASAAAAATAGRWHREQGIYLLWGPGIKPQTQRARGRVDQVAATLLSLLGLPPGQGLAGPPLPGAPPAQGPPIDYGIKVAANGAANAAVPGSAEEIAKLGALGYLGRGETRRPAAGSAGGDPTRTAASYNNEGMLRRQGRDLAGAAKAFAAALALDPENASAAWNWSDLLSTEGREPDRADELLLQAIAHGLPDAATRTLTRAATYTNQGKAERAVPLLDRAVAALPGDPTLRLERGRRRMEGHRCAEAATDFAAAAKAAPESPLAHASLGLALLCQGKVAEATPSLRRSLELDPNQPPVAAALRQIGGGP